MANCCSYKVKVRGRKNACYAFYSTMPCMDYIDVDMESGSNSDYTMVISGNCKWAVDSYCERWDGDCPVFLPDDPDKAFNEAQSKYTYRTIQDRSKMFGVEVWCISCDEDGEPWTAYYEHYISGKPVAGDEELPDELDNLGAEEILDKSFDAGLADIESKLNELESYLAKFDETFGYEG